MAFILGSASPRRRELLTQIGCDFTVITSEVVEDNTQELPPDELVVLQAKEKALDVAYKAAANDVVIGADTIVVLNGQVYGKPKDADDARRMLFELSGKEHQVITGVAVVKEHNVWTTAVNTKVKFIDLNAQVIDNYLKTGEPMDKAGAYAIQGIGALFIEEIKGSYSNVVGLPLKELADLCKKAGAPLI